jgi:hypothetical protein
MRSQAKYLLILAKLLPGPQQMCGISALHGANVRADDAGTALPLAAKQMQLPLRRRHGLRDRRRL